MSTRGVVAFTYLERGDLVGGWEMGVVRNYTYLEYGMGELLYHDDIPSLSAFGNADKGVED